MWSGRPEGGVALLVDFENLVRGVERGGGELDCGLLTALAAGCGRLRVARAYADWRMADTDPHRERVARAGIEAVDVPARRDGALVKNAVDVRMAADADLAWSMPGVATCVLATGDGDFVPVVRALQRCRKTVVGVCPEGAASFALANACDAFVDYATLADGGLGVGPAVVDGGRSPDRGACRPGSAKRLLRRIAGLARLGGVRRAATAARRDDDLGERVEPAPVARASRRPGSGTGVAAEPDGAAGPAGMGWVRWVRERLASGAVAANADDGWLHRMGEEAFVVVPDCFEACAAADGVAVKTVKNRVMRLGLHRMERAGDGAVDLFRAALGDGRVVRGMLFPGRLLWGDEAPETGSATLTQRYR